MLKIHCSGDAALKKSESQGCAGTKRVPMNTLSHAVIYNRVPCQHRKSSMKDNLASDSEQ